MASTLDVYGRVASDSTIMVSAILWVYYRFGRLLYDEAQAGWRVAHGGHKKE